MSHAGNPSLGRAFVGLAFAAAATTACENDVSVQLLPVADAVCLEGEACSGLSRALYFSGPYDRVEIANSPLLDVPQDFAIEAWVLVKSYTGGHGILNRWTGGIGDIQLTFGVPEPVSFSELPSNEPVPSHVLATWGFVKPDLWLTTIAPSLPSVDAWHHLATSYGGGSLRLYVDGVVVGSMDGTEAVANASNTFFIGATARHERSHDASKGQLFWPPMHGYISEVRISSTNRYPEDFVPEPRLLSDAATIALWHLDEGAEALVSDSGPNQLHGVIIGAEWALAPVRPAVAGL